jgi:hypothetical protein
LDISHGNCVGGLEKEEHPLVYDHEEDVKIPDSGMLPSEVKKKLS